jgi:Domain of unknown function (DUF1996)
VILKILCIVASSVIFITIQSCTNKGGVAPSTNTVLISSGPSSISTEPYALFVLLKSDDIKTLECSFDNEAFKTCSNTFFLPRLNAQGLYDDLPLGAHTFSLRGINSDGAYTNTETWAWTIVSILSANSAEFQSARLIDNEVMPETTAASGSGWKGIFRINCEFDHASYDDPIVFPGFADMAHLHSFYGNKNVDAHTTFESLYSSTGTGCSGSTLNRSAYWVPTILAPSYDQITKVRKVDSSGNPAWEVVKAKVGEGAQGSNSSSDAHEVFYYSAAVDNLNSIKAPPTGLRIIAGNSAAGPSSVQSTSVARYHCVSWASSDAAGGPWSTTIPECGLNDMIRLDIFFPSCWDGVNLDSANHKDHMAYPITTSGLVCPSTHPVPVARVSFHYSFPVIPSQVDPTSLTSKGFRLSSDGYTVNAIDKGGMSLHGDWFNGWHPEAMDLLLKGCIKGQRDCHDGNFATISPTGQWTNSLSLGRLTNAKGTEIIPAIINLGLGH